METHPERSAPAIFWPGTMGPRRAGAGRPHRKPKTAPFPHRFCTAPPFCQVQFRPAHENPRSSLHSFHRNGVDAFILRGELRELIFEREIVGAKFIELGFVHDALGIEHKRTVALGIKRNVFRRNFRLRRIFEFQGHKRSRRNAPTVFSYTLFFAGRRRTRPTGRFRCSERKGG